MSSRPIEIAREEQAASGVPAPPTLDLGRGWMPDMVVGRVARLLHLPYLAVSLVVGIVLMLPLGQFAPAEADWLLVDSGHWGVGVLRTETDVLFWVLLIGLVTYDLVAMRWMRARSARTLEEVRDVVPGLDDGGRGTFALSRDWRPAVLASLLYVGFMLEEDIRGGHVVAAEGIPIFVVDTVLYAGRIAVLVSFVWTYAASLYGLWRLCRRPLRLVPHLDDAYLGTRPLGRLSLSFAMAFFAGVAIIGLWLAAGGTSRIGTIAFVSTTIAGLVFFFLPLYSVHQQMVVAKHVESARSTARLRRIFRDTKDESGSAPREIDLADLHAAIGWGFVDARVRGIRTWPFDTTIVVRLAMTFALPMLLAVLTKFTVEMVLGV